MSRRLAALLAGALTVAGCTIGEQDGADRIDPAELQELAGPATDSPGATVEPNRATLYFVHGDMLRRAVVDTGAARGALLQLLRRLEQPPPAALADEGVRTALPPGLIAGVDRRIDGITVDLSSVLNDVDPEIQQPMFGQLVLTLTDLPPPLPVIERVRFTLDGVPQSVPLRDNTLSEPGAFVTREDYELLLRDDDERPPA